MKWQAGLKHFRESRGLTHLQPNFLAMFGEEVTEYDDAVLAGDWHEQVDAVCDQLVLVTNCIEQTRPLIIGYIRADWVNPKPSKSELLAQYLGGDDDDMDILLELSDRLQAELTGLGVVPDLAMKQVVKHISSRVIDPAKKADFESGKLAKWPKMPDQDPDTIYQADYTLCRAKKD